MHRLILGVAIIMMFYGHVVEFIPTIYPLFSAHPSMLFFWIIITTEILYHTITVKEPHEQ